MVSLAQQLNALLIGLGGAFLAMLAIVAALPGETNLAVDGPQQRARRDFFQTGICLVVCALVGVLCLGVLASDAVPQNLPSMIGLVPREQLLFDIALVFVYFCCIGLLESLKFLEIVVGGIRTRSSAHVVENTGFLSYLKFILVELCSKSSGVTRRIQIVFLLLLCLHCLHSYWQNFNLGYLGPKDHFWLSAGIPLLAAVIGFVGTCFRRWKNISMRAASVPPSSNLLMWFTGFTAVVFYVFLYSEILLVELIYGLNLTLVFCLAVSSLFTSERPFLGAKMEEG